LVATREEEPRSVSDLAGLAPLVLIAVVFWFLLVRPQRRRQMELMSVQRGVEVGDEVMLGAGILGRVAEAGEEYLRLEVDPGVHLKVARQAVVRVVSPDADTDAPTDTSGDAATNTPTDGRDLTRDSERDH
jgi:preprotein translocase subunit YajC